LTVLVSGICGIAGSLIAVGLDASGFMIIVSAIGGGVVGVMMWIA
jgi:hypothetical protein